MSGTSSRSSLAVSLSVLRGGEDTPARSYRGELSAISGSVTCGNTLPPRYLRGRCGSCGKLVVAMVMTTSISIMFMSGTCKVGTYATNTMNDGHIRYGYLPKSPLPGTSGIP